MTHAPYFITTPIYYVNDKPHIGHAYTTVICDIIARFARLDGRDVCFLTGTDEHGLKVQQSAEKAGMDPLAFVEPGSNKFKELFQALNVNFDTFIRTTEAHHKRAAQHLWQVIADKGLIYKDSYRGWYSVRDECYYAESELIDGMAPTGAPVEWIEEESYFFKLSAFEKPLLAYYQAHPDFIQPESRRNEVIRFVESGLRDLSISRQKLTWGIPVPGDDTHVMYVWFDALTNYISALGYPEEMSKFKKFWPTALHIVGKDILRFHAVYWPAMLMAAGIEPPKKIFAHGFWTREGQKMSKSLGNGLDPYDLINDFSVDATRFFMAREVALGQDGDYSRESFIQLTNSHLANDLGNLAQRVLSMIYKNCEGQLPTHQSFTEEDLALLSAAKRLCHQVRPLVLTDQAIQKYVESVWTVIRHANQYVDGQAPWALRKTDISRMQTVLYVLAEVLRYVAILIQPLMPQSAAGILDQLAVEKGQRTFAFLETEHALKPGTPIVKPVGLFPRFSNEEDADAG